MLCTAWRWPADNAANTLAKGTRVIVTRSLRQFEYTATVHRITPGNTGSGAGAQPARPRGKAAPADDPWATAGSTAGGGGFSDEPPFWIRPGMWTASPPCAASLPATGFRVPPTTVVRTPPAGCTCGCPPRPA